MSEKSLFCVSDPSELLALWRLVAEAKFQPHPDDVDLWGSPYVHALAQRISEAQIEYARTLGNTEDVQRHLNWVSSLLLRVIKAQLKKDARKSWWSEKSHEEKLFYVKGCIAPFQAKVEFLESRIREAEA